MKKKLEVTTQDIIDGVDSFKKSRPEISSEEKSKDMKFKSFQAVKVDETQSTEAVIFLYALGVDGNIYLTDVLNENHWKKLDKF